MEKETGYNYRMRTVEEMRAGELEVVYDMTELDNALATKKIKYREWSKRFSALRQRFSCTIGGSAVGTLFGNNKYQIPSELQKEIRGLAKKKKRMSRKQFNIFARGHMYEEAIGNMNEILLEQKLVDAGLAKEVTVLPFKQQVRNKAFPNCLADFDCIVRIKGGKLAGDYLGEIKSTSPNSDYWNDYFNNQEAENPLDRIPPAYLNQMDFYLGVAPFLKGGIMLAACGFDENDHAQIIFERNDERSLEVLNVAQEFCEKSALGYIVSDDVVKHNSAFDNHIENVVGELADNVTDISDGKYVEEISNLTELVEEKEAQLKAIEKEEKRKIKEKTKDLESELKELTKKRDLLVNKSLHLLKENATGVASLEDGRKVQIEVEKDISWNTEVKTMLQDKYPEAYAECEEIGTKYTKKTTVIPCEK